MPSKNALKVTIGKETTAGTAVTPTAVLPITGTPKLIRKVTKEKDSVIVGAGMQAGQFAVAADTKGGISLSPRSCPGFGQVLKGAFGNEAVVSNIIGVVRMRYKGSSASCKLVLAATTITSKIGALGSEANDSGSGAAGFGTSGVYTITAGTTTLSALIAAINGFTNYEASLLAGAGASTIQSISAVTATQAKGKWAVLLLVGTSTGVYAHRFTPDLVVGSERPAFTLGSEYGVDNIRHAGNSVNGLSFDAALKGKVECEVDFLGMTEAIGQAAMSGLSLNDSAPFIFGQGITSIGGTDFNYTRSMSAKVANNLKEDGYGQSSLDRSYHAKDIFGFSGDLKLRLDAASYAERAKVETGVLASEFFLFYGAEGKCVGSSAVRELMLIEVPYAEHSNFDFEDNGEIVDCSLSWEANNPGGAYNYDQPVIVTMLSSDSAEY